MTTIIPRATWGAQYRDGVGTRKVGRLEKYLHNTATKHLDVDASPIAEREQMRVIERIGQQRFGAGISYTFLVFPSGRIYQGASIQRISYHSGGAADKRPRNTLGASICLAGNYDVNALQAPAKAAIVWLLQEGVRQGWWGDPALTEAHRDFKPTACPGKYAYAEFAALNALGRGAPPELVPAGEVRPNLPNPKPAAPGKAPEVWQNRGHSPHWSVDLAARLNKLGYPAGNGEAPDAALRDGVKAYQEAQEYFPGMVADGDWGNMTHDHYNWTRRLQRALSLWRAVLDTTGPLDDDGDYRTLTARAVAAVQDGNKPGAYKGWTTGEPTPQTCKMLGIPQHPSA